MHRSFSDTRAYRVKCLRRRIRAEVAALEADNLAGELDGLLVDYLCPRCTAPFEHGLLPAGSRVTSCRCIPVCSRCGEHESFPGRAYGPHHWPLDDEWIADDLARWTSEGTEATLVLDEDTAAVLTDDAVGQVRGRGHPGGWAEFGMDEDD
jgi:hypothetical protein